MTNTLSVLNPEVWKPVVQDYLNNMFVGRRICNVKCEELLSSGDQVNFPYVNDVRVQSYAQGTDLTADALSATQDSLLVNQSKAAMFVLDPVQERQAKAAYGIELARQSAYVLGNNIDQQVLQSGITNAASTIAGGTLTASTLQTQMTNAYAELFRNNATDAPVFAVLDAERTALLTQTFINNGFTVGDATLRNGFKGRAYDFDVYTSNNLPSSVGLTLDTQPTNLDTFTIMGVTWTCVTDGTAAAAGEINIGANIGDFKNIFLDAINNGTSLTADWVDVAVDDRRKYQNAQLAASAFSGDVTTLTAYGKINGSETFTAVTNIFGTETTQALFGRTGAISLAIQMYPELYVREEPLQIAKNYITHTLFGSATFYRDTKRLVKMTHNA